MITPPASRSTPTLTTPLSRYRIRCACAPGAAASATKTARSNQSHLIRIRPLDSARVQKYVLSELDSGQRVITERLPSVRSVALGFWIGAGSRDETPAKAGVTHFIEHLLFKGTRSYSAQDIAEAIDALGGELNAATSREHTVVYVRVADHHLEKAFDMMSDMVYAPVFAELDAEREVVLEEIAMYEDAPHELVHDLMSEAVFGDHPLGRPVSGSADVIASIGRRALTSYHRTMYAAGNIVFAAAGNLKHDELLELLQRAEEKQPDARRARPPCALAARQGAASGRPLSPQEDRAVPRVSRRAGNRPLGPSPVRRLAARLGARRLGVLAALPGDPGEARDGLRGLHVRLAVHRHRPDRPLRRHPRREPDGVPRDRGRADQRDRGGAVSRRRARAGKENLKGRILLSMEATSNRMSRLGRSLITDTELLSLDGIVAEIDGVTQDAVSELAGVLLAPERLSAAGIGPSEGRFRESVRRIDPALGARAAAA